MNKYLINTTINDSNMRKCFFDVYNFVHTLKIYDQIETKKGVELYGIGDIKEFFQYLAKEYNILPQFDIDNYIEQEEPDEYIGLRQILGELLHELDELYLHDGGF